MPHALAEEPVGRTPGADFRPEQMCRTVAQAVTEELVIHLRVRLIRLLRLRTHHLHQQMRTLKPSGLVRRLRDVLSKAPAVVEVREDAAPQVAAATVQTAKTNRRKMVGRICSSKSRAKREKR